MFSGAAPLAKHVEEFLRVTCCCVVSQGYGINLPKTALEIIQCNFSLIFWFQGLPKAVVDAYRP